ncbi:MAG: transposase [Gammaproteobacteria bacterium]|nr:transposase [Gammaproteobacteria bacterium]
MSLDVSGFVGVRGGQILLEIKSDHPLLKLSEKLPWEEMLMLALPDLERTEKKQFWRGRRLQVRVHLGAYILQQMYDLSDRQTERLISDNGAFQFFCGYGHVKNWHVPDHTSLESFRSRLLPETHRTLSNLLVVQAVKCRYANPAELDVDSTIQGANISPPSSGNLLLKVVKIAKKLSGPLNQLSYVVEGACGELVERYQVSLAGVKGILRECFEAKRLKKLNYVESLKRLWVEVAKQTMPIIQGSYALLPYVQEPRLWGLRRSLEQLSGRGRRLLENAYAYLFEGKNSEERIYSLSKDAVSAFNKNKLNRGVEYGRAYQLGRIGGNFMLVGECETLRMPDAASLPAMVELHASLFGEGMLDSVSVDKGYYSAKNEGYLQEKGVKDVHLPRPNRVLTAAAPTQDKETKRRLHNRRAGIEPLIGHIKQGGQMRRSRMKSDVTTLSSGYAAVFGFNLRQLLRHATGQIRPVSRQSDELALKRG